MNYFSGSGRRSGYHRSSDGAGKNVSQNSPLPARTPRSWWIPFTNGSLARGFAAAERYGFALAGGYAVQAAGLLERPSEDIDLFTGWNRRDEFSTAVEAVVQAYRDDGLTVDLERRYDTFARLTVSDGSQTSKVELGVDWRANEPILIAVGPVLRPNDAVANK